MRNKVYTKKRTPLPDGAIRMQPAASVPYGENITRRGNSVWCAYLGEQLVGTAATADEARHMYRAAVTADRARAVAERKAQQNQQSADGGTQES